MKKYLTVMPFQETLDSSMCGPASLKIVLNYYGVQHEEHELAELCRVDSRLGTDHLNIKRAAQMLGFDVFIKNHSEFEDVFQ